MLEQYKSCEIEPMLARPFGRMMPDGARAKRERVPPLVRSVLLGVKVCLGVTVGFLCIDVAWCCSPSFVSIA
jgi:hypothetical protein